MDFVIGAWCNGSTADFGSVYPGSKSGRPSQSQLIKKRQNELHMSERLDVMLVFLSLGSC